MPGGSGQCFDPEGIAHNKKTQRGGWVLGIWWTVPGLQLRNRRLYSARSGSVIDPAIKYLNKGRAMPNRMPHFRESEKWPDQ
jgi:hypothetical protein